MTLLLHLIITCALFSFTVQFQVVKIGVIFFNDEMDLLQVVETVVREINDRELSVRLEVVKHFLSTDDSIVLQSFTCDFIEEGVSAILGPSSKTSSEIVTLICQQKGIPHLKFDWHESAMNSLRPKQTLTVNVAPTGLMLSQAYSDMLQHLDWKSFTIVYEESSNLALMQNIFAWKQIHKSGIKLKSFRRDDDYRILWKNVNNAREKYVILHCSSDILVDMVKTAMQFNMTGPFNHWFLTNLNTHTVELWKLYSNDLTATIRAIRVRSYIPPHKTEELDALGEDEEDEFLQLNRQLVHDAVVLFYNALLLMVRNLKYKQPIKMSCDRGFWPTGSAIIEQMKKLNPKNATIRYKTQRLFLNELGERDDFNLMLYDPLYERTTHFWNRHRGLVSADALTVAKDAKKRHNNLFSDKEDLSQRRLRYTVATRVGEPYFMWKEEPEGEHYEGNDRFTGYAVDLIYKLSEECKFDFVFEPVADNNYGTYDAKADEWNGIIRQLIDNNAQIGVCDLTITQSRRSVVDFTVPFMQLGLSILYYKAAPIPPKLLAFLNPFTLDVWVYLLLVIVIMSFIAVFIGRLSHAEWVSDDIIPKQDAPKVSNVWSLLNTLWLNIGSIMAQGCDILPRGAPMRIYVASYWIFALIISQTYIAQLASVITSAKMKSTVNSLHDLVEQNRIKFGFLKGGSTSVFFSESNDSDYRVAWNKMMAMKPDAFTGSNKEGVDRVLRSHGDYAFLMETTSLQYYMTKDCDLTQMGKPFGEKHYGLAVPLNAPYRSNLSVGILKLSEKGVLYKLKKKWFDNNGTKCSDDNDNNDDNGGAEKLKMDALRGLFLVLIAGICLAFSIGIFEFLLHVHKLSVRAKIPTSRALKSELKFFLCFWKKRKPIDILAATKAKKCDTTTLAESLHCYRCENKKKKSRKKSLFSCCKYNK